MLGPFYSISYGPSKKLWRITSRYSEHLLSYTHFLYSYTYHNWLWVLIYFNGYWSLLTSYIVTHNQTDCRFSIIILFSLLTIYQNIDILQYSIQYNMANRKYQYCNILISVYCVAFSRLKNRMTNKCIKVIISTCLWLSAFISYIEHV